MAWIEAVDSLGGIATSDPSTVLQTGGRLVVCVRGADNSIWHRWQVSRNGNWSGWESLGGPPGGATSGPDVTLNAPGGLVIFARGGDGAVWHIWQEGPDGNWSTWESLGGAVIGGPAAALYRDGRLNVFARGLDNAIWTRWQTTPNGDWAPWESIGGVLTSDPAACLNAPGGLVVFARGEDQAIWHTWQDHINGDWYPWESLGGMLSSGPSALLGRDGRLSVLASTSDRILWHRYQTSRNGNWSVWEQLGFRELFLSDPSGVRDSNDSLVVFGREPNGGVMTWRRRWVADPPPPKPPVERTTVPNVAGLLSSQARERLDAARLRIGHILNLTGEIRSDHLRVVHQDPEFGTSVDANSLVNYSVELAEQEQGVQSVTVQNRHQQGRSVELFVWGPVTRVWSRKGTLGVNAETTIPLTTGQLNTIIAVDRGLINCNDGQPDNLSCHRWLWGARGDANGVELKLEIF